MAKEQEKSMEGLSVEAARELVKAIFEESRKPDPALVAKKEAERLRFRESEARRREAAKRREAACTHLRDDNTSRIAWMENSDGNTRGVCQWCNTFFDIDHPRYVELRRIPTRAPNVVI